MVEKSEALKKGISVAKEKLTYAQVANMFNDLNKILRGEYYSYAKDLKRPEGGKAIGFVYTGYAAGVGLRNILQTLHIKYSVVMKGGSGFNENSEIHIDDEDKEKMLDIIGIIGERTSQITTTPRITGNRNNPLFEYVK